MIGAILVAAVLAVTVPLGIRQIQSAQGVSTVASVDPTDYPAFTAEYLVTFQQNGVAHSQTWKVDYNSQRDWRKEEVAVTGNTTPSILEVGTVWEFKGSTLTITRASGGKPITVSHPEGFIPFSWLHAGRLSYLRNKGEPVQVTQITSGLQANGQQVVYGNPGSPLADRYTLNARGVPVEGDVHSTGDVQFKALSFTFK